MLSTAETGLPMESAKNYCWHLGDITLLLDEHQATLVSVGSAYTL